MDGTIGPVKRIIANADVVFAVWFDPAESLGIGMHVIKGRRQLAPTAVAGDEQSATTTRRPGKASESLTWNAVPCMSLEQAIAAQWILGDID
jgi:hypothetical protein